MHYTDYYATLGLNQTASPQEIRKAYRRLAKDYHPDTHPGDRFAEKNFKDLNEAYEVLGDEQKRSRYDQLSAHWSQYQHFEQPDEPAQEPARERTKGPRGDELFDLNFSDFFETFFGEQSNAFWHQHAPAPAGTEPPLDEPPESAAEEAPAQDADLSYFAEITLEEALSGTRRRIQVRENQELRNIDVKIPSGVVEGSRVRVGGRSGNYYLEIRLLPHPVFEAEGRQLRVKVSAEEYQALLGDRLKVPTLTGSVQMKIPAGSQNGQIFRIRGQGLAQLRQPDKRGDLLVQLDVKIARDLSEAERELIERFRDLRQARSRV